MLSLPVWLPDPIFLLGGSRSLVPCPGGLCSGSLCQGDRVTDGTHPTGMLSCYLNAVIDWVDFYFVYLLDKMLLQL